MTNILELKEVASWSFDRRKKTQNAVSSLGPQILPET